MLLGHTTFAEQAFQDARLDAIHNNSFGVTQSGLTFSTGSVNFFLWNEVDDSQTVTWIDVDPGSTD